VTTTSGSELVGDWFISGFLQGKHKGNASSYYVLISGVVYNIQKLKINAAKYTSTCKIAKFKWKQIIRVFSFTVVSSDSLCTDALFIVKKNLKEFLSVTDYR